MRSLANRPDNTGCSNESTIEGNNSQQEALSSGSRTITRNVESDEENKRIRRLQRMMSMVMQVIQQDRSLPLERASRLVADARKAALAMFPDKELAFDLIFWSRVQRMMRERYRMQ